jgi:hypothetical protein
MTTPMQQNTRAIWQGRDRLLHGDVGMTLGLTHHSYLKCMNAALPFVTPPWAGIILGHGDGIVAAFMSATGASAVFGVEINDFALHRTPQAHAERMLAVTGGSAEHLLWGRDILDFDSLEELVPVSEHAGDIMAFAFDDTIPMTARKHWYTLLSADDRVSVIVGSVHAKLAAPPPHFEHVTKFSVNMEGGNCRRTQRVLTRT